MQKNVKGSALVFSLVVMFIILTAALGVASVAVIEKKNSSATGKSNQAFQMADSAVELVLKQAATDPVGTTLDSLGDCDPGTGVVKLSNLPAEVSFVDANGDPILTCSTNLSQVSVVKSVATYSGTTRAISTAVAAGTLSWIDVSSFSGSWHNYSASYPVQYAKDSRTGIVYVRGLAVNGSGSYTSVSAGNIFCVDSAFRPAHDANFPVYFWNSPNVYSMGRVDFRASDGCFNLAGVAGSTAFVTFDGIFYSTN